MKRETKTSTQNEPQYNMAIKEAVARHVETVISLRAVFQQIIELRAWVKQNDPETVENFVFQAFGWSVIRYLVLETNILLENHRDKECRLNENAKKSKNLAWVFDQIKLNHANLRLVHREKWFDYKELARLEAADGHNEPWIESLLPADHVQEWQETPYSTDEKHLLLERINVFFKTHQERIDKLRILRDKAYAHHDSKYLKAPGLFERDNQLTWSEFQTLFDDLGDLYKTLEAAFFNNEREKELITQGSMIDLLREIRAAQRLWKSTELHNRFKINIMRFFDEDYVEDDIYWVRPEAQDKG